MTKLILIKDIDGVGTAGQVVEVSDGYARNFLLPKHLAVKASAGALKNAEDARKAREETMRRSREEAEALATQLVGSRVVIAAQSGDEGKLFGSIGVADIVEGVKKFTGVELDRKTVRLAEPIKSIGLHEATIKLHADVEFALSLDIIPA
ncbi:MAG TPA: 50S ribosomal protein L9 [Acidimicrobiia bacterium]|nr:50S ribosomal protein L9 [Acidimicrobiia bacterium]